VLIQCATTYMYGLAIDIRPNDATSLLLNTSIMFRQELARRIIALGPLRGSTSAGIAGPTHSQPTSLPACKKHLHPRLTLLQPPCPHTLLILVHTSPRGTCVFATTSQHARPFSYLTRYRSTHSPQSQTLPLSRPVPNTASQCGSCVPARETQISHVHGCACRHEPDSRLPQAIAYTQSRTRG